MFKFVHDHDDPLGRRVVIDKKGADAPSPIDLCLTPTGHHGSPPRQLLEEGKQARGPVPPVVVILPARGAAAHLDRRPHLLEQLARHLVHADHWPLRVVGPMVDGQDIFHLRDKAAARLRQNSPLTTSMRLESVALV